MFTLSVLVLTTISPACAQPQVQAPPNWGVVSDAGIGPVRIGMTERQALAVLGPGWLVLPSDRDPDEIAACRHIGRDGDDTRIGFMVEAGRISRVEIDPGDDGVPHDIRTPSGARLGMTEAQVRAIYGPALVSTPHTYAEAPARYLTVWTRDPPAGEDGYISPEARGVRFVTGEDRRVQAIYAGTGSIAYVEGCL